MKIQSQNINNINYKFSKNINSRKENNFVVLNVKTSSLDVLSLYGKAQVSFTGNEINREYKKRLHDFAYNVLESQEGETEKSLYGGVDFAKFLSAVKPHNIDLAEKLCFAKDENEKDLFQDKSLIFEILSATTEENLAFAEKLCFAKNENGEDLFERKNFIANILEEIDSERIDLAEKLCFGIDENGEKLFYFENMISAILPFSNKSNQPFVEKLSFGKDKNGEELFDNKFIIYDVVSCLTRENMPLAEKLCFAKDENGQKLFSQSNWISKILSRVDEVNLEVADKMCFSKDEKGSKLFEYEYLIEQILRITDEDNIDFVTELVDLSLDGKCAPRLIAPIIVEDISISEFTKAKKVIGENRLFNMLLTDVPVVIKFHDLYQKEDFKTSLENKKTILKLLLNDRSDILNLSPNSRKDFPLLPSTTVEYSNLLKNIVATIAIQTKPITKEEEQKFYSSLNDLAKQIKILSDEEYNNLSIDLSYPTNEFIKDINNILKGVDADKKQKVLEYFGFRLEKNDKAKEGYSIVGYPLNIEKNQDETIDDLISQIQPFVIKFSENNKVFSNNKQVENSLNEILMAFPELTSIVGKKQHSTHSFDVFKHSLKVMQKVVQNPEFERFDDSDKKLLLIATLLHDVAKMEGKVSSTHAITSAFDSFYLIQKLDLAKDEKIKLYSLIKEHEWLGNVNKLSNDEEKSIQKKSVAYDLHYGNLFEMAKVFTQADLKAVKNNDDFYIKHKDSFEQISNDVETFISQLKNTQPLLPVTKFPTASRIKEAITQVNDDYTTNLNGVFQDEKGMVILKFNEIEDETWEKIGFPKGSFSKGITAKGYSKKDGVTSSQEYNTGNIKFFVHGFDREDQLANFNAFKLPDSDALLSVSYAERPESKYRFYRNKGLILNTNAKYIHGGGKSDSGSGYTKNIDCFKRGYAYEGSHRHADRKFISELIKHELNLSDEQYLDFIKNNANKPFSEIEPKEMQVKLIQALATINSKTRHGERNYNEMYISNPEVMGVFAYDKRDCWITSMKKFINQQDDFMKNYALNNDLPFVVFGG